MSTKFFWIFISKKLFENFPNKNFIKKMTKANWNPFKIISYPCFCNRNFFHVFTLVLSVPNARWRRKMLANFWASLFRLILPRPTIPRYCLDEYHHPKPLLPKSLKLLPTQIRSFDNKLNHKLRDWKHKLRDLVFLRLGEPKLFICLYIFIFTKWFMKWDFHNPILRTDLRHSEFF